MDYRFTIDVPFESIQHEALGSSSSTALPSGSVGGFEVAAAAGAYVATVQEVASDPGTAMQGAVARVEDFLGVLAILNDAFHIRYAGVVVTHTAPVTPDASAASTAEGVTVGDHLFMTGHLGTVKAKGSLDWERAVLTKRDVWPPYVRSAMELNYLAVSSEQLRTRFLLTMIALESLAFGRLGPVAPLLAERTDLVDMRAALDDELSKWDLAAGDRTRLLNRLFGTTARSPIDHICDYFQAVGVEGWDPADVKKWWAARGALAHGGEGSVDDTMLSLLRRATQEALRREVSP